MSLVVLISSPAGRAAPFTCLVEPARTLALGVHVAGVVDKVTVRRGDRVKKGQLLISLASNAENAEAELAKFKAEQVGPLQTAQAKAEFAKRKFERKKALGGERLMSQQEVDEAESEYRVAQSEIVTAKENKSGSGIEYKYRSAVLALRTVYSPFDGVVVDQSIFPGEVVEAGKGSAILKVARIDLLHVRAILPKEMFGKVKIGQKATVETEILKQKELVATVKSVDGVVDAASGTFVVVFEMPNPKSNIPVGVRCKAELIN
ncbi:efflux RND transporter periplasmic adaptor subunit [Chitinolyticbacter meiyuanensis]|uniref:efflux RND transporter periplasmic adaptor subunit n=1 Tax=Chitinolyticbacter meiyuanensis TaxID=682798 RepID=UPI001651E47D|nr:efflux RND transporter periplasmic adaptor subunit [Chitinolyticbacter meiyuanensis]